MRTRSPRTYRPAHIQTKGEPMFLTYLQQSRRDPQSIEAWREAAELVWARWGAYLAVEPESRTFAFASYLAALDAEEAAAFELAAFAERAAA